MPVEVVGEFEGWRQVRDSEGTAGWVFGALLSGRRMALVLPWEAKGENYDQIRVEMRKSPASESEVTAYLSPGVLVRVRECDGQTCRIVVKNVSGYVDQKILWGVYKDERVNQ